ncbi:WPP domain-interacting tail-anchored protein 1-like [Cynara cardunculus var. scolymus]|uniref:WPP domain-interacting tail-anchored protein 1-like n=1 Tax=Cynara cardunculus var. scolymus TaxID=59895 RepID=UPI000D62C734|nr:WPP domain-interacting tail-anchored protein 1-like [Cynara cardunculus var. scolymus]
MDLSFNYEPSSAAGSVYSCRPESEFYKSISRRTSSVADTFQELESVGEVVTRFELDMACVCEKLANLNLLLMHVEAIESDFEAFVSELNPNPSDLYVKALTFDFLSGFLNSEVTVLENQISDFQMEKTSMQEFLSSSRYLGDTSTEMEDMLHDSEKSLQQSMEQLLEIKARSAMFEKKALNFAEEVTRTEKEKDKDKDKDKDKEKEEDKDDAVVSGNDDLPELKDKMNMHAVEHQRHILRMLEKSLERELEFEKRANESTQIEEALTMRLHSSEQEVLFAEEETVMTLEKLYEADHTSEILMGISKELLKMLQLDHKHSSGFGHQETAKEGGVKMDNSVKCLKARIAEAERRAENAEAKCRGSSEKVVLLEKELRDAKIKLQLRKTRKNSLEDMESMVVMMVGVEEDLYSDYSWTVRMDAITNPDASSPPVSLHSGGPESELNKSSTSLRNSSSGDTLRDSESTEGIITRFELDIACISEKLNNLNLLLMYVETKESDFEAFVSGMDPDSTVKALEFDLLSGILNSEVRVLETHISDCQTDKANVMEFLSSRKHLGEPLMGMEEMLHDSEKSLEQSMELVLDIKVQSAHFEKNLLRFARDETWKEDYTQSSNNGYFPELKEKMKMQTVEHRRHILRMLERSLKRELDSEKQLSESIQIQEDLTMRLNSSQQEVLYVEAHAEMTLEKFYEADHASALLMAISKELLSTIKMLQFNLKGLVHQEAKLKSDLLALKESIANEKASMEGTMEMKNTIRDLREQAIQAERRVLNAETKCQVLTDSCQELKDTYEKVVLLEKELSDTNSKLQNVEACYEAGEEDKTMLNATIIDMCDVIQDLKEKVSQAKYQTEIMEDKCILLSENNEGLKKELSFVRGRVNCLEESLHQTEETKKATAKDISLRTKLITDLVMQMALERERLQKQISSLKHENKILVARLKKTEGPAVKVSHGDIASSTDHKLSENDFITMTGVENKESLSTTFKPEKACNETVMGPTGSASELEVARNIDARELKLKGILLVILILIMPLCGLLLHQTQIQ